jgi:multisubunit Na+/H+ antiporter MnhB subunit
VTSVILDFRAFDTLGEVTVLFAAALGVLSVVRTVGRKKLE